jgi:acyl-CoA reductase-like NAD-dependent aldehyde dehydrogenase
MSGCLLSSGSQVRVLPGAPRLENQALAPMWSTRCVPRLLFLHQGQTCMSTNRIIVDAKV